MAKSRAFQDFAEIFIETNQHEAAQQLNKKIFIRTGKQVAEDKIPYAAFYQSAAKQNKFEENLKREEVSRLGEWIIVARGDTRSPDEIAEVGGFNPQASSTGEYKDSSFILHPLAHRISTKGSGLVSCTSNMEVAKKFATDTQNKKGYVYIVRIVGAFSPSKNVNAGEGEYSVPGGIDVEDIIAYRQIGDTQKLLFTGSPMYIRREFTEKYPLLSANIMNSYLESNEQVLTEELDAKLNPSNK